MVVHRIVTHEGLNIEQEFQKYDRINCSNYSNNYAFSQGAVIFPKS